MIEVPYSTSTKDILRREKTFPASIFCILCSAGGGKKNVKSRVLSAHTDAFGLKRADTNNSQAASHQTPQEL
jgi:hypothetical protein